MGFQFTAKWCYISYRLSTNREFHRVGAATEKTLLPTLVLTLGTKSRLEVDVALAFGSGGLLLDGNSIGSNLLLELDQTFFASLVELGQTFLLFL